MKPAKYRRPAIFAPNGQMVWTDETGWEPVQRYLCRLLEGCANAGAMISADARQECYTALAAMGWFPNART